MIFIHITYIDNVNVQQSKSFICKQWNCHNRSKTLSLQSLAFSLFTCVLFNFPPYWPHVILKVEWKKIITEVVTFLDVKSANTKLWFFKKKIFFLLCFYYEYKEFCHNLRLSTHILVDILYYSVVVHKFLRKQFYLLWLESFLT